jgi:hypothetical protein
MRIAHELLTSIKLPESPPVYGTGCTPSILSRAGGCQSLLYDVVLELRVRRCAHHAQAHVQNDDAAMVFHVYFISGCCVIWTRA